MSRSLVANRVTVLVMGQGRHLFETVADPRVRVVPGTADVQDPDLIVCPCGHDRRFDKFRSTPFFDRLRRAVALQRIPIVFDASTEGVQHKPDITASLHELLMALGASPQDCVYVTQDRGYGAEYRSHCASIGFKEPVAVLNHDYWITEKVIRPLVNFHPMVVFGNAGVLATVRRDGFESFGEMFDESYDEEPDPRTRFDLAYRQVSRMCRVDERELQTLEAAVTEKLIFNAHWGLTRFAAVCRAERDVVLVNAILTAVNCHPNTARLQ